MSEIKVNGRTEVTPLASGETLIALLGRYGIEAEGRGLAIAVNGAVVRRGIWQETVVSAGDIVEIVRPFQGG